MKRKDPALAAALGPKPRSLALERLIEAMLALRTSKELHAFLDDLCTPAELEAIADRWRVVPLLREGVAYREIHERTGVSVTTTGRVARTLEHGHRGYAAAVDRLASR